MAVPAPNLDNRRFDDIRSEVLQLIPRYTQEWTDFNASDPGITFIDLYSWMIEMALYRLNQVPDLSYIKFLELIGIQLRPAEPARAELSFSLVDPPPAPIVSIPQGLQVAAAGTESGPPVVFETDRAFTALGPKLGALLRTEGASYTDLTQANRQQAFLPFGPLAQQNSALLLGFDFAQPFPALALDLAVFAHLDAPQQGVHCSLSPATVVPPAQLVWEYWDGMSWVQLPLDRDETVAFTRSGHVQLQVPNRLAKLTLGAVPTPLYWIRCRVFRAGYERPPQLDAVLTNTVPATQAQTVTGEILGGTDGMPGQTFRLFFSPVLAGTLQLDIDEGDGSGFQRWSGVEDFYGHGPDDRIYVLDRANSLITLPDGRNGRIAVANASLPAANVRATTYRYGGGSAGNLAAGAITQLMSSVDGVAAVTNLRPAEGGSDQETVDEAKTRAPAELSSRKRAVTAADFTFLAQMTPDVRIARAEALAMTHPGFPGIQVPGAVTVVVLPDTTDPNPTPSEATLENVCAQLNRCRLLTTEVYVVRPAYRLVKVEAQIRATASADLGTVRRAVEAALTTYFHPLKGGEQGKGWALGGEIYYSLVYKEVLNADPGVARIDLLFVWLDGERQSFCQDVPILDPIRFGPQVLLYSSGHDIQVSYA